MFNKVKQVITCVENCSCEASSDRPWPELAGEPLLEAISGRLGPILGPSWGQLGPSWANLGPTWGRLGPTWDQLGGTYNCQEGIFCQTWPILAPTGPSKAVLGAPPGCFGASKGLFSDPSGAVSGPQFGPLGAIFKQKLSNLGSRLATKNGATKAHVLRLVYGNTFLGRRNARSV